MKPIVLFCTVGLLLGVVAGCAEEPKKERKPDSKAETREIAKLEKKEEKASPGFTDPSKLTEKSPETFKAQFDTTKGKFTVEVTRSLSPNGADRFYNLVRSGYFKDVAFFRVVPGFMCQFGMHGDPKITAAWYKPNVAAYRGDQEIVSLLLQYGADKQSRMTSGERPVDLAQGQGHLALIPLLEP